MENDRGPAEGFDLTPRAVLVIVGVIALVSVLSFALFNGIEVRAWCACSLRH